MDTTRPLRLLWTLCLHCCRGVAVTVRPVVAALLTLLPRGGWPWRAMLWLLCLRRRVGALANACPSVAERCAGGLATPGVRNGCHKRARVPPPPQELSTKISSAPWNPRALGRGVRRKYSERGVGWVLEQSAAWAKERRIRCQAPEQVCKRRGPTRTPLLP